MGLFTKLAIGIKKMVCHENKFIGRPSACVLCINGIDCFRMQTEWAMLDQ